MKGPDVNPSNHLQHSRTAAGIAVATLCAAAGATDLAKLDALMALGTSRAAAIEIAGRPDREVCGRELFVPVCRLEWKVGGLFNAGAVYRVTFIADRLVSKNFVNPVQKCTPQEQS